MTVKNLKCVVVGDGATGKTSMLVLFTTNTFDASYLPTVFDNHSAMLSVDNQIVALNMFDTAGQEDLDRLRPLSYPLTDVFVVTFSVISQSSFASVSEKWVPEIRRYCPTVPIVLVGTKSDLRDDPSVATRLAECGLSVIPSGKGGLLCHQIGGAAYVECSSLTGKNINRVFEVAVQAALCRTSQKPQKKRKLNLHCELM